MSASMITSEPATSTGCDHAAGDVAFDHVRPGSALPAGGMERPGEAGVK